MFGSVRLRLTQWYVGVLALVLVVFSIAVYAAITASINKRVDSALQSALQVIALSLSHEIEEHQGKIPGEESFRTVLQTMQHTSFPQYAITVREGDRLVASKSGTHDANAPVRRAQLTVPVPYAGTEYLVSGEVSLRPLEQELATLRQALFISVPVLLALAATGGWFLARKSLAPVAAMNTTQRQFMADASHELRTPISVARTAAQVTLEARNPAEDDYRDALSIVEQQMKRLTRIVEEMFLLAQADSGVYPIQRTDFYLDDVLREAASAAAVLGARRGVSVIAQNYDESPCIGDEDLLRQLVLILLDNGVKYTPAGGTVTLGLERYGSAYRITVTDTGTGIPAESRSRIFDRFYRVDKARSRSSADMTGGAGLGLAIARWIAEVHGGEIKLEATSERGSTFSVLLEQPV